MKRYCQTLTLKDDPELIAGYVREHSRVWPEIKAGIREVGILDMQIYLRENLLFMIVDTTDDFFVGSGTCCHCFDFGHLDYN